MEKLHIINIAHHRNGISGVSFYVVLFDYRKMAIVFPGTGTTAVLDREMLSRDIIEFGQNSWRGDAYEENLREAVTTWEKNGRPAFEGVE